jgi:RNA polymerase sigma-70 factor (ECF subfamily)
VEIENHAERLLIERFNNGDLDAFRQIYNTYMPVLLLFATKFTDRETARDLVQDVFMQLWKTKEELSIRESLQSYLYRAVRNKCINYLEHLKVVNDYEMQQVIDLQIREAAYFQSPEQLLIKQEQLDLIKSEIEKLPPKSKEIFKMAYFYDKKAADIADELQISVRTVETQIYKALKTLRQIFVRKITEL